VRLEVWKQPQLSRGERRATVTQLMVFGGRDLRAQLVDLVDEHPQ
jgi:hypothetical protein